MLDVPDPELRERLTAALGIARWVDEVAAQAPYPDVATLVAAGRSAATPLSDAELDEAVAHHPRIGERAEGTGTALRLSAGEQSGLGRADEGVDAAIARGNAVYEERFGRVFLIRAAGRTREEVADELQRRLTNAPEEEAEEAKEQLRQIMELRLRTLFPEDGAAA
ncbi:2-oxo-4-hydroxy-4-carboxy-5-ureidoimidazoline decarboxylase [Naasia aerilata]|uniref:2-oxo-4-hydroxy-4-carboxy-5-ureidoimidazoline decarboxylase n=1 Tax=Naasia aerilata TaxID=1162966 RepID=A0ABM8GBP2_9MICO|nr:2-oxo-4-hydroxy-4-carboxy-5-ureidoimidazoline decarboxylase [Naasia aerilata]BDZ45662.1 OHCU decarboxylase [Naasia aerilata]